jgi:hypothetical protein
MSKLSAPETKRGWLQRACLEVLREHERDDALPTNGRFLFYELLQSGVVRSTASEAYSYTDEPVSPDIERARCVLDPPPRDDSVLAEVRQCIGDVLTRLPLGKDRGIRPTPRATRTDTTAVTFRGEANRQLVCTAQPNNHR